MTALSMAVALFNMYFGFIFLLFTIFECFGIATLAVLCYTYVLLNLCVDVNHICLLTTVFNVGEYRRKAAPHSISNADFFRPDNKDAQEIREYDFAHC